MAFPPIACLLPHAPPMVLLDEVIDQTDDSVTTLVTIRSDAPFFVPEQGIPAHVGLEYMAQTCGAFAGLEALMIGQPVRLGFLLGSRRYQAFVPWLLDGWRLSVTATVVFREGQMGVFDCRIRHEEADVAMAQITVYRPDGQQADREQEVG